MERFIFKTVLDVPAEEAYAWHTRPGALDRLVPPWANVRVMDRGQGISNRSRVVLALRVGPFPRHWTAEHADVEPGRGFSDIQVSGPFAAWRHEHRFHAITPNRCELFDAIEYRLPGGAFGEWLGEAYVSAQLNRLFHYRQSILQHDLMIHQAYGDQPRMRILVTGASGLLGRAVTAFLSAGGHQVMPLKRIKVGEQNRPGDAVPCWNPATGQVNIPAEPAFDAVIHLAGETIAQRWTQAQKERIRLSRVAGTRQLSEALARLPHPPRVFIGASGLGYYGNGGDEPLSEDSPMGRGFLAEMAHAWETAADPLRVMGTRVAHARLAMVLDGGGGALPSMAIPFRLGLGGTSGSGTQYWSWIALDDVLGAIHHILMTDRLSGPINVCSPAPLRNRDFARILAGVLRRPAFLPAPAFALRLVLGEMANELLLSSQRAQPGKLLESGFSFGWLSLEEALRHVLGQ